MRLSFKPFSGRVIFDHFPKTAGQAVANWLRDELGDGTVSPNLVASHRDVLNRSFEYPIVTGHVFFEDGEGFEPRFEYVTLLREPVDRTLSFLFFVTRNHRREDLPKLYDECEAFLASDGEDLRPHLAEAIANPMVTHYAQILGMKDLARTELVDTAFRAIQSYDCIGTYERLSEFIGELARFLGVASPNAIQSRNVTRDRPKPDAISAKLRKNILAITDLDREFYDRVSDLIDVRMKLRPPGPCITRWSRFDRPKPKARSTSSFELVSFKPFDAVHVSSGGALHFELEFELGDPVKMLLAGILIHDDRKRCAFGINNYLLGRPCRNVQPGRYRAIHSFTADFPAGEYTVGFAFSELRDGKEQEIYWQSEMVPLTVHRDSDRAGVGYAPCKANVLIESLPDPSVSDADVVSNAQARGPMTA